jgi:peroxiredoxin
MIDPDGEVAEVLRKVKPAEHDALVLKALQLPDRTYRR